MPQHTPKKEPKEPFFTRNEWLIILIFIVVGNIFIAVFMKQENALYFWDLPNYWIKTLELRSIVEHGILPSITTIMHSINVDEYNYLGALFLMPFQYLFGFSRAAHIHGIFNMFVIPATITLACITKLLVKKFYHEWKPIYLVVPFIVALARIIFLSPSLNGYVDAGGIVLIGTALFLYFKHGLDNRISVYIRMGLLLGFAGLFRRWYYFWIVTFIVMIGIFEILPPLYQYIKQKIKNHHTIIPKALIHRIKNYAITGISIATLIGIFSYTMITHAIFTDYKDLYTAYRSPLNVVLPYSIYFFGLVFLFFVVLGASILLFEKRMRKEALFLLIPIIIIFFWFSSIHNFGHHQFSLFATSMILLATLGIIRLLLLTTNRIVKKIIVISLIFLAVMTIYVTYIPASRTIHTPAILTLVGTPIYPRVLEHKEDIVKIYDDLVNMIKENETIYVLPSSYAINEGMLTNVELPIMDMQQRNKFAIVYPVDRRDGFPNHFFKSTYVMVSIPEQYHLNKDEQYIIHLLSNALLKNDSIGRHYEKLPQEYLLGDIKILIYKKMSAVTAEDVVEISKALKNKYPNNENVYTIHITNQ